MHFVFISNSGANSLAFGTSRSKVRSELQSFKLTNRNGEPEVDFYVREGFLLGYDVDARLEYIEVFPPSTVDFDGLNFFTAKLEEVARYLNEKKLEVLDRQKTFVVRSAGFAFYCPNQTIESVSLFKEGYYDH